MAQSVKRLTSAQVTISWVVSLSLSFGSVLTDQSLKPALDSVSPSLSPPPSLVLCLNTLGGIWDLIRLTPKLPPLVFLSAHLDWCCEIASRWEKSTTCGLMQGFLAVLPETLLTPHPFLAIRNQPLRGD